LAIPKTRRILPRRRNRPRCRRRADRGCYRQAECGGLYATLDKGPKLPPEYQKNSTRHFMARGEPPGRDRVIDRRRRLQNYPEDYQIIESCTRDGQLTVRIAYN